MMPAYVYTCQECGLSVDVVHSMKETHEESCQGCGGELKKNYGTIQLSAGATPSRMKAPPVEHITPEEAVRRRMKQSSNNGVA